VSGALMCFVGELGFFVLFESLFVIRVDPDVSDHAVGFTFCCRNRRSEKLEGSCLFFRDGIGMPTTNV
jgi:hypothetical protein